VEYRERVDGRRIRTERNLSGNFMTGSPVLRSRKKNRKKWAEVMKGNESLKTVYKATIGH
jgi:hypothetical protein